jgi:hypothetical protein
MYEGNTQRERRCIEREFRTLFLLSLFLSTSAGLTLFSTLMKL